MNHKRPSLQMLGLTMTVLLLIACGESQSTPTPVPSIPTVTPTPAPTLAPTAVPPTVTPTFVIPTAKPTRVVTATPEPSLKILFLGNSKSFYNGGLDLHMESLTGSADPPLVIQANHVWKGGFPLRALYTGTEAREVIANGAYDVVVLQEALNRTSVDLFHEYARKFDAEIAQAGGETVLLMAWPHEQDGSMPATEMGRIAQAHRDIATELGIDVAPVGLAWQCALQEHPDLDLFVSDGIHPSIHGTYLAINVVYATVLGENPIDVAYLPPARYGSVTEEEAAFLQRIAWETVQEYQAQK